MTKKRPCGKANIIMALKFIIQKRVLRKIQGGLYNKEKLRGFLTFESGCTDWQTTPQNLSNIYLPNLVG